MKKIIFVVLQLYFTFFNSFVNAQEVAPYIGSVEVIPLDPQSGPHNYFGVKVTIDQTYDQDITFSGYIHDVGSPNTDHPYTLTITAGNTTEQTSTTFYETFPTSDAVVTINSIVPLFVTKDNTIYITNDQSYSMSPAPATFTFDFATLAGQYFDSLAVAISFLDSIINGFTTQQEDDFFTSLNNYGVSYTASSYSLNESDLLTIESKLNAVHAILIDLAKSIYGDVDSLNHTQFLFLINSLNSYALYSIMPLANRMEPGGCDDDLRYCLNDAWYVYIDGIANCTLGGLGLTGLGLPWVGLGYGIICNIRNSSRYGRAKNHCYDVYNNCITH